MSSDEARTIHTAKRFIDFADEIELADTADTLRQVMIEFHSDCGIEMMSYHHLPPPGALDYTRQIAVIAHGFPRDWVQRYEAEFMMIDPITRHALSATNSFLWSDAGQFDDLSDAERYYLEQLYASKLGDGLAVPVFGPLGRSGYVGLGFGSKPRPNGVTATFLQSACQLGHQRYCSLLLENRSTATHLSPRESEIMIWVARGKSNSVIAQILGISGHTVDTHLRRTFGKLGVQDRVTAVLRGAALGLL